MRSAPRRCQQSTYQGNGISRGDDRGQAGQVASPRVFFCDRRSHLLMGPFRSELGGWMNGQRQTEAGAPLAVRRNRYR